MKFSTFIVAFQYLLGYCMTRANTSVSYTPNIISDAEKEGQMRGLKKTREKRFFLTPEQILNAVVPIVVYPSQDSLASPRL